MFPDGVIGMVGRNMNVKVSSHEVSSPIRTLTVGSGFSPDLLTSQRYAGALAGFSE